MQKKKPYKIAYIGYTEHWKYVYLNNEVTKYQVSDLGRVRNVNTNKILETTLDRYGYVQICLSHKNKKYVKTLHRIVAETFLPNNDLNKNQVNHINGKKYDNSVYNLEWVTAQENVIHAYKNNLHVNTAIGEKHGMNRYTEDQIVYACKLFEENTKTIPEISKLTKVSKATLHDILKKKYWTHISNKFDIDGYSNKKLEDFKNKIIPLAKLQMTAKQIRKYLNLPYDDKQNAIMNYYIKKYKNK